MKTKILILISILSLSTASYSQKIIDTFINMPETIIPKYPKTARVDMAQDFFAQSQDSTEKSMKIERMDTTLNFLSMQSTDNSKIQILLYNIKDSTYNICLINSVSAPITSSYIEFYNNKWEKIGDYSKEIKRSKWIEKENGWRKRKKQLKNLNLTFIEYYIIPEKRTIMAKNNSIEYLTKEEKKELGKFLNKKPIKLLKLK